MEQSEAKTLLLEYWYSEFLKGGQVVFYDETSADEFIHWLLESRGLYATSTKLESIGEKPIFIVHSSVKPTYGPANRIMDEKEWWASRGFSLEEIIKAEQDIDAGNFVTAKEFFAKLRAQIATQSKF